MPWPAGGASASRHAESPAEPQDDEEASPGIAEPGFDTNLQGLDTNGGGLDMN